MNSVVLSEWSFVKRTTTQSKDPFDCALTQTRKEISAKGLSAPSANLSVLRGYLLIFVSISQVPADIQIPPSSHPTNFT